MNITNVSTSLVETAFGGAVGRSERYAAVLVFAAATWSSVVGAALVRGTGAAAVFGMWVAAIALSVFGVVLFVMWAHFVAAVVYRYGDIYDLFFNLLAAHAPYLLLLPAGVIAAYLRAPVLFSAAEFAVFAGYLVGVSRVLRRCYRFSAGHVAAILLLPVAGVVVLLVVGLLVAAGVVGALALR